jgi:AmiR/NasT family two-component response regulator
VTHDPTSEAPGAPDPINISLARQADIGRAVGALMVHERCGADAALEELVQRATDLDLPVHVVAADYLADMPT